MIKKDITFNNLDDVEVTKTFYFHFNKLEGAELELEYGGLEEKMEELTKTEDSKEAYAIFKDLLLRAVGKKSPDGSIFLKSREIRDELEFSPALAELIFEFFTEPENVGPFLEGMLPAKDVREAKLREERERLMEKARQAAEGTAPTPVAPAPESEKVIAAPEEMNTPRTDEEILAADISDLDNNELARLVDLRRAAVQA